MTMIQHPACAQCTHTAAWPSSQPCAACYWNGGLTNSFSPAKEEARRATAKNKAASTAPAKQKGGRRRPRGGRATA